MLDSKPKAGIATAGDEAFELHFPERNDEWDQDEERFVVQLDGETREFRCHDYGEIYTIPGLYEQLFYEELKCQSPERVCGLLAEEMEAAGADPAELRVFDVGAGNGMIAEELAEIGAETLVGVDIIPEAAEAAERDRPGLYDDYHVLDLTDIPDAAREKLERSEFNCMTVVAALGFGDIPPLAFAEAFNLISDDGWIAFNIKEDFLGGRDSTGFSKLMRRMSNEGVIDLLGQQRYRHRVSVAGEPLHYVAIVGRKRGQVPLEWAQGLVDD